IEAGDEALRRAGAVARRSRRILRRIRILGPRLKNDPGLAVGDNGSRVAALAVGGKAADVIGMAVRRDYRGQLAATHLPDVVGDPAHMHLGALELLRQLRGAEIDEHVPRVLRGVDEGHEKTVSEPDLIGPDLDGRRSLGHGYHPSAGKRRAAMARWRCRSDRRAGARRAPSAPTRR